LFFKSSFSYRVLYSFPTRRSSDLDFDFMQSHKETSVAVGLDFWLSRDDSGYARRTRLCSGDLCELICWCVDDSRAVEREKCCAEDRKSTRLNSSHVKISYAVFCLK